MKAIEKLAMMHTVTSMLCGENIYGGLADEFVDPLEDVDIEKEYELIKLKKSKLSANLRSRVVRIWESGLEDMIGLV